MKNKIVIVLTIFITLFFLNSCTKNAEYINIEKKNEVTRVYLDEGKNKIIEQDNSIEIKEEPIQQIEDDLTWTNEEAFYVTVYQQYIDEIYSNVEETFKDYKFDKIYLTEKYSTENGYLDCQLLFIVKNNQKEFLELLNKDERVAKVRECKDLPYEGADTLKLTSSKTKIEVGEILTISLEGKRDIYTQMYSYSHVTATKFLDDETEYTVESFESKNIKSVNTDRLGRITIELKEEGYFETIKLIDELARNPKLAKAGFIEIGVSYGLPSWQTNNDEIVEIISSKNNYEYVMVKGLNKGTVIINLDNFSIEITVE